MFKCASLGFIQKDEENISESLKSEELTSKQHLFEVAEKPVPVEAELCYGYNTKSQKESKLVDFTADFFDQELGDEKQNIYHRHSLLESHEQQQAFFHL
jgi:hypothetical protein